MKAIAYLRVSTDEQARSGLGLEAQEKRVRAFAQLYDVELVDVVVDAGMSAKTLDRPGLVRALAALEEGRADALLVAKLDRLTRSVRDLGDLVERYFASAKWALISVAENVDTRSAAGRLVLNVLGSVAQWEREAIGERTSAALAAKKARGERVGGVPFGFRAATGGKLEAEPREAFAVSLVRELRAEGRTLRGIVSELEARGVVGRTGKPLQLATVHSIARATT